MGKRNMKTHKDLEVWKNSLKLVSEIYAITNTFPREEIFGLTSQIRRASVSIASNISEGAARNQKREFIRFMQISMGSLAEVETQLTISLMLKYMDKSSFSVVQGQINQIRAQLSGLIRMVQGQVDQGDRVTR
jgi:four helix bundle protein